MIFEWVAAVLLLNFLASTEAERRVVEVVVIYLALMYVVQCTSSCLGYHAENELSERRSNPLEEIWDS